MEQDVQLQVLTDFEVLQEIFCSCVTVKYESYFKSLLQEQAKLLTFGSTEICELAFQNIV